LTRQLTSTPSERMYLALLYASSTVEVHSGDGLTPQIHGYIWYTYVLYVVSLVYQLNPLSTEPCRWVGLLINDTSTVTCLSGLESLEVPLTLSSVFQHFTASTAAAPFRVRDTAKHAKLSYWIQDPFYFLSYSSRSGRGPHFNY